MLAKTQRLLALNRADVVLLFLIIFVMSVKPSFGDGSFWIAVVVLGVLGAFLVWNGMNARVAAAPATEQR